MGDRQTLARVIKNTASYYNRSIDAEVLSMMCDDLNDLSFDACIDAYNRYRRNPANKSFPLPAQIRELVNPEEFVSAQVKARETAARIVGAVSKYGWNNGREAQVYIGPVGWEAVKRQGGWSNLCQNLGQSINPATFQAQLRDQLEGSFAYGNDVIAESIGAPSAPRIGELSSFGDVLLFIEQKKGENDGL